MRPVQQRSWTGPASCRSIPFTVSDFYRELGDIFSITIRVSNRWSGFKALRARWLDHLGSASRRPVVLIDEAQEMTPMVLSELRLLASARFGPKAILSVDSTPRVHRVSTAPCTPHAIR